MKYTPNQNFIFSLCLLPCIAELGCWTLLHYLSTGLAALCSFKGEWIVQNSDWFTIYALFKNPPHWQTMRIWSGTQTIVDLTSSSLLAWGFHKWMMHFDFDTEGFSVRMWSSDERRDGFFSTQLSLIKQCNKKKCQFSICISHKSFTWPLITLPCYETMTVKPMRDWNAPGAWCVLFCVLRM